MANSSWTPKCDLCGLPLSDAAACARGDCPIERKPEPSIHPYPRFINVGITETSAPPGERPEGG